MTQRTPRILFFAIAFAAMASSSRAQQAGAGSPPTPPRSDPPPPAAKALPSLTPPDSAVALCADRTWIREPGVVGDCSTHGGLGIAMPMRQKPPVATPRPALLQVRSIAEEPQPSNATGRCKDGTYLIGPVNDNSCSSRGGIAARFPQPQSPPQAPPLRP